jgi:uncharacterized membrane protein YkoI
MMQAFSKRTLLSAGLVMLPLFTSPAMSAEDLKGSIKVGMGKESEYPTLAKISLEDAVKTAITKVPGKAVEAELEREDGYLVYEVNVVSTDNKKFEIQVDAGNNSVLHVEEKKNLLGK